MVNKYYISRRIATLLTFVVIGFYQLLASYGKYPVQNFSPATYKAGIQNIDFAQNRNMSLFVANNLGVLSYNGNDWEVHAYKTGKKIRSLAFDDRTDRLYIGSQGEFGYFTEKWEFISLLDKIPKDAADFDEVWDVFLLDDYAYFCTFQGIYVFDGTSISVISRAGGFSKSFYTNGKLFTQSEQGDLFEIRGLEIIPTYLKNPNQRVITGIISQAEGYLLFYNSGEIEFSTPFGNYEQYDDLINALKGRYVNHVFQLSDTRLVVATQTSGLFLYNLQNQSLENITTREGLSSNACLRSFQDYAGNLWVGTQNGIALIDINSPVRFVSQGIGIQGSGYDVFEQSEGTYFTTSNGIYFLAKNSLQGVFLAGTEGPAYGMQKIAGKLYAGHHMGLFLLENGQAKQVAATEGLWQIKQLRAKPEFAIAGTYSGLYLFKLDANMRLQPVRKIDGFNESSRFFEEDRQGKIWVSQFYKGLYHLTLSTDLTVAAVERLSGSADIPIDEQVIISTIDNEFYLATDAGVYQLNQSTNEVIPAELFAETIGNQPVYLLVQDYKKNIHVIAENLVGFFKQISPNNYVFVPSSLFQMRYYFNNDLLNVSMNANHGVWFNANEGFIHYRPQLEKRVQLEKPFIVSDVTSVTEDSLLYAKQPFTPQTASVSALMVSQNAKVLQFAVESYQFVGVSNQQFRYFLKGFDEHYSNWTNTTVKEYANLPTGNYEFLVQTRNALGSIITSSPLLFAIDPPFYKTYYAKVFYFILAGLLLFQVLRFQRSRYKKQANQIEEKRKQELAEKQQKLVEIEQRKEQEVLQLKEEKIQSELLHLNSLLAASTMNLVVKNEFIETIKDELKQVKEIGKNIETKSALEKIVKKIDATLRVQEDWDQFEHHFNQVHGDFLNRLRNKFHDLTPNEQKLCAFLRLNLNTKDIANLMGISLRGVEIARYRLRKKLDLQKGQNLSKFVLEY
ncbi:MAG: triple tyrosine motif-containing protein [Saprospiraceae bacterium]